MDCCIPNIDRFGTEASPLKKAGVSTAARQGVPAKDFVSLEGEFLMGTRAPVRNRRDGEDPIRRITLSPFSIATTTVTNREFAAFVEATGHVTEAERFGWSFVFNQFVSEEVAATVDQAVAKVPWWWKVDGAWWREPEGSGSSIDGRDEHPVVHVSWNDAVAYAEWAGGRLPTEAEWEFAARGGLEQALFPWGDDLTPGGRHMCNIWQGDFPNVNTVEDGHFGTAPVSSFEPNGYGLYNVSGNVWEWCSDWFSQEASRRGAARRSERPSDRGEQDRQGRLVPVPRVLLQPVPSGGEDGVDAGQFRGAHGLSVGDGRGVNFLTTESAEDTEIRK